MSEPEARAGTKVAWSAAYINDLPDSAFAWVEAGGEKDEEGKTVPRDLRHYPHHDAAGDIDLPHLRNALARVAQDATTSQGKGHLQAHADAEDVGKATTLKFVEGEEGLIEGLAIPYGGPVYLNGKDLHGEDFGPDTDLALDWFPSEGRPFLYNHGTDDALKATVVGRQVEREALDIGQWVRVQLDKRSGYFEALKELVGAGGLWFSSGAIPHLVQTRKDGHILRWPWVELSATPTPAHPGADLYAVKMADAIDHLTLGGDPLPEALKTVIDENVEATLAGLPFTDHADRLLADVEAFAVRAQDLTALRAKSGRVLSASRRERLAQVNDALALASTTLYDLLAETDPEAQARKDREFLEVLGATHHP